MSDSSDFLPGFIIGGFIVACIAGILIGDSTTPAEYKAAEKVCEANGGLKKITTYLETQKVVCINGAYFSQDLEKIELEALSE